MSQGPAVTTLTPTFKRGWYVSLPADRIRIAGAAHYYETAGRAVCGTSAAMIVRWTVPEHCGVVRLCDECRRCLAGGP